MDSQAILTWNTPNFISVALMSGLAIVIFFFVSKAVRQQSS